MIAHWIIGMYVIIEKPSCDSDSLSSTQCRIDLSTQVASMNSSEACLCQLRRRVGTEVGHRRGKSRRTCKAEVPEMKEADEQHEDGGAGEDGGAVLAAETNRLEGHDAKSADTAAE
jgi:hypothetical protein